MGGKTDQLEQNPVFYLAWGLGAGGVEVEPRSRGVASPVRQPHRSEVLFDDTGTAGDWLIAFEAFRHAYFEQCRCRTLFHDSF